MVLRLRPGFDTYISTDYPMPADKARFVGEVVAMVIAETIAQAKDGAELVEVDYEPLPAVARASDAVMAGAPQVWDGAPSNLCVDVEVGDEAATGGRLRDARRMWCGSIPGSSASPASPWRPAPRSPNTKRRAAATRSMPAPAAASPSSGSISRTCWASSRNSCAASSKTWAAISARAISSFPEYALLAWAAKRIARPVKWTCERREAFLSDYQGRDLTVEAELALDEAGNFLALRGSNLSNVGAHTAAFVSLRKGLGLVSSVYRIPVGYFRGRCAVTHTVSTTPYRSAGRPEAIFIMERLIDIAADTYGIDPVELRRRNLIPPQAQPYANPLGLTYDNGNYEAAMDMAIALAGWDGFAARRAEAKRRGRLLGIGIANYIEITSGNPRERTEITVRPEGEVELVMGTMNSGQGHETSFAQLVTEWLGVPFESIRYVAHDTDRVHAGGGSHSGRSMKMATIVVGKATDDIVAKGKEIAAHLLETDAADIVFDRGRFRVAGTDRDVGIFDVASAAATRKDLPAELQGPLGATSDQVVPVGSFPYGTQVCEVEVDPDTGAVEIVRYAAVDDVGRAVNPLILHGQTHGGIAQGAGQALLEECHYDRKTAQLLSASFMDYAMPRADTLPNFATAFSEVPTPTNRLGVRSGGEGGTTPALAVVINAIVDAVAEFGVRHIEMPATPERVWRAIQEARAGAAD